MKVKIKRMIVYAILTNDLINLNPKYLKEKWNRINKLKNPEKMLSPYDKKIFINYCKIYNLMEWNDEVK